MPQASALSESYELDPGSGVLCPRGGVPRFNYNDGDAVEQRLLEVVSAAGDLSVLSLELARQIQDWPSRYHLAAARANLLRPLEPLIRGRVLEVGAGCGAVTRYLGECGAEVVAVEGSFRRASVAAARCRDLPNVRVVCDRFENLPPDESFDAVTLIGVLEWTRLFGDGPDPVQNVLARTRAFLREGGSLLLAIENQLGLKYFAGYVEDHTAVAMHGINDLYGERTPVTFGRHELMQRLHEAGYRGCELYLPLPDYKLPTAVITSAGLDAEGWPDAQAAILSSSVGADPQSLPVPFFSLEKAFRVVARNRLVADLANSFLIRATAEALETPAATAEVLAVSYATSRRPQFVKETSLHRRNGQIEVRRRRLTDGPDTATDLPLQMRHEDEPFRAGRLWTDVLCDVVNRPGWTLQDLAEWTRTWISALATQAGVSALETRELVPGRWLDATPHNLIEAPDGTLHFIDLEWETDFSLELGFLLFRGLLSGIGKLRTVAEPAASVPLRHPDLVARIADLLGLRLEPADVERHSGLEIQVQWWATGLPRSADALHAGSLVVRPSTDVLRDRVEIEAVAIRREQQLRADVQQLQQELAAGRALADAESVLRGAKERQLDVDLAASRRIAARAGSELDRLQRVLGWRRLAQVRRQASGLGGSAGLLRPDRAIRVARLALHPSVISGAGPILRQGLFDPDFYRGRYPDVGSAGVPPLLHYLERGHTEGRWPNCLFDPSWYENQRGWDRSRGGLLLADFAAHGVTKMFNPHALFDVAYYLERHPEVKRRGLNPLAHYLRSWRLQRQSPHPVFDVDWYLSQNPDVDERGSEPVSHFWWSGAAEGRDPHPLFSVGYYLRHSPGVAGANPLTHFLEVGGREGLSPHPLFDTPFYLLENDDVRAADVNPLVHYLRWGASEGRSPNALFDARFYLSTYPDVAAAGVNPLLHYVQVGEWEGRRPSADFSPRDYLAANPDVARSGLGPLAHYLRVGRDEKRRLRP